MKKKTIAKEKKKAQKMQIYEHEFWLVGHFVASDEHTLNSIDGLLVVVTISIIIILSLLWRKVMPMMMQTIG